MNTIAWDDRFLGQAAALAALEQRRQRSALPALPEPRESLMRERLEAGGVGRMAVDGGRLLGYLRFDPPHPAGPDALGAGSPLWGYALAKQGRFEILGRLFEEAAGELGRRGVSEMRVRAYARDEEALRMYAMTGFRMDTADRIRPAAEPVPAPEVPAGFSIREMGGQELLSHRAEMLSMYRGLIDTLRHSPVFYPCEEFFPLDRRVEELAGGEARVFALLRGRELAGMIDAERPDIPLLAGEADAMALGDVFVKPDLRGRGLASALLRFAAERLQREGVARLCVTHGTANPLARGFWGRHFAAFSYALSLRIDRRMLGDIPPI